MAEDGEEPHPTCQKLNESEVLTRTMIVNDPSALGDGSDNSAKSDQVTDRTMDHTNSK